MSDEEDKNPEPEEITEEDLDDVAGGARRPTRPTLGKDFSKGLGPLAMERVHEDE